MSEQAAIITTGSREYSSYETIIRALNIAVHDLYQQGYKEIIIREGGCKTGADSMVREWVNKIENSMLTFGVKLILDTKKAEWYRYGNAAGPIRNQELVDAGGRICLAFFEPGALNKGTNDCVQRARKAGIEVKEYWHT